MNIYENFIENTGAKQPNLNTIGVLEGYKSQLQSIETSVTSSYNQLNEIEDKLRTNDYSVAFIREYMEKEKESMNKRLDGMFNTKATVMEKELDYLKERALLSSGDKEISRNNILKLQAVLPNLSNDDKEQLFESSKDKDPNVLEILYLNVKEINPSFASTIMEYLDEVTGEKEIKIVENQLEQIKGLKSYMTYDYIKSLDAAYQSETIYSTVPGGAINRVIGAYKESIDKLIESIKQ